jgi:hypothetical protein
MNVYSSLADDYYINLNLNTEMTLPQGRETILGFFERIQKQYPSMRNFYTRENGDFVLEEDKDQPHQRWIALEPRRICSGVIDPTDVDSAVEQHALMLRLAPYMLSVSPIECEALDYMMGFDFSYRGNHDELVAEALGAGPALDGMISVPGVKVLNYEPSITISLDETCRRQARLMVETRTNAYQVRRGEFSEDQISVYFTVRQYGGLEGVESFEQSLFKLRDQCDELMHGYVVDHVLRPLQQAISAK